jgi:hypothetical protein
VVLEFSFSPILVEVVVLSNFKLGVIILPAPQVMLDFGVGLSPSALLMVRKHPIVLASILPHLTKKPLSTDSHNTLNHVKAKKKLFNIDGSLYPDPKGIHPLSHQSRR